ncbi:PIN domain-containing protein [Candidatus Woesearchaeota archaeon]|nr:PIN domain-containing protein [Candidatus Woesearchaeota archaeon]
MPRLIYIDTNVYLDYLLGRNDRLRPIGDFAFELIRRAVKCEFEILISELVIDELENNASEEQISQLLNFIKKKTVKLGITEEDILKSRQISRTDSEDALHYLLAKKGGAEFLVTRNIKHFDFPDLQTVFPENL